MLTNCYLLVDLNVALRGSLHLLSVVVAPIRTMSWRLYLAVVAPVANTCEAKKSECMASSAKVAQKLLGVPFF